VRLVVVSQTSRRFGCQTGAAFSFRSCHRASSVARNQIHQFPQSKTAVTSRRIECRHVQDHRRVARVLDADEERGRGLAHRGSQARARAPRQSTTACSTGSTGTSSSKRTAACLRVFFISAANAVIFQSDGGRPITSAGRFSPLGPLGICHPSRPSHTVYPALNDLIPACGANVDASTIATYVGAISPIVRDACRLQAPFRRKLWRARPSAIRRWTRR
jgi:hypothetical protein